MEKSAFPSTIQAITFSRAGGVEVVQKQTVPFPKQRPGQLVVKVRTVVTLIRGFSPRVTFQVAWAGVNMIDTYFRYENSGLADWHFMYSSADRTGLYPVANFPFILGHECSGIIQALPADPDVLNNEHYKARGFKVGGRVGVVRVLWLCSQL